MLRCRACNAALSCLAMVLIPCAQRHHHEGQTPWHGMVHGREKGPGSDRDRQQRLGDVLEQLVACSVLPALAATIRDSRTVVKGGGDTFCVAAKCRSSLSEQSGGGSTAANAAARDMNRAAALSSVFSLCPLLRLHGARLLFLCLLPRPHANDDTVNSHSPSAPEARGVLGGL